MPSHGPARSARRADALRLGGERLLHRQHAATIWRSVSGLSSTPRMRHQPAQERRVGDRAASASRSPSPCARSPAPAATCARSARAAWTWRSRRPASVAGGDHRRREEEVVADPDRDAVRLELHPQRAPERLDPGLGRAVGAEPGGGEHGRRRGDQQQVPAAREHVRHRRPRGAPDAEQVDVDRLLDRLRRDQPQRPAGRDAGVGDRDVDAAEAPPRGRRSRR